MDTHTFILTGFEPFGGSTINPSILACRKFENMSIMGYNIKVFEIPLKYAEIKEMIENIIEQCVPSAILCLGQSNRPKISLERVAINVAHSTHMPYNCGYKPINEILERDGPVAYFSTLPLYELQQILMISDIPAEISNTAGTYGCNQTFYHLMHKLNKMEKRSIPAGFIHVPCLPSQTINNNFPSMSFDLIEKALKLSIEFIITKLTN